MNRNKIKLVAYSTGTTEARDTGLEFAEGITCTKGYPGGMSLGMEFFVPRDVTSTWTVEGHQRIVAWNGLKMAWEGKVVGIAPTYSANRQGMKVTCAGMWHEYLDNTKTRKPWADTRTDEATWTTVPAATATEKCDVDRVGHLRFNPRREAWKTNDAHYCEYVPPTGQTIKRVTFSYDFQERAQNWTMVLRDITNSTNLWTISATGTGTQDITLGTPSSKLWLYLGAGANQTPPDPDPATDVYGTVSNLVVYTETGAINAQEITKDVAAMVSGISTDLSQIGAETVSLVPFINEPARSLADVVINASSYGDSSYNRWSVYVGLSENFSDGLPGLVLEAVPALTDYDYAIRLERGDVNSEVSFNQDFDAVRNWIAVSYTDASGRSITITPDDDANLKDTASIALYGQREEWISLPASSTAVATNYGRRFLATRKDPQWVATGEITVVDAIRAKNGQMVPACEIVPGKRVKFENWLNDLSGTGLTFLISGTTYNDTDKTCSLNIGTPDPIEFAILRM